MQQARSIGRGWTFEPIAYGEDAKKESLYSNSDAVVINGQFSDQCVNEFEISKSLWTFAIARISYHRSKGCEGFGVNPPP